MAKPLHLLHVFPSFGRGGMELRVASIMNGLGADWRHGVLALNGRFEAARSLAPGIQVKLIAPPGGGTAKVWALRRILAEERADLVVTYNWGATDAIVASLIRPPSPIVHNECGFNADEAQKLKLRRMLARRVLLRRASQTIVVSTALQKIVVERFGVPPRKVRLIRTGVDTDRFTPQRPSDWRERLGVGPEDILFGFAGAFRLEKNLPLLVRAFAEAALPNAVLALAGDGAVRPELERLARELGVAERVRFAGSLEEMASFYSALDVFVLSSDTEQTPNSLLEAMAAGRAALATDVGDCAEILGARPGDRCVVPPRNCTALAQAIRWLGREREARLSSGGSNRARVEREYSRERMVREYGAAYAAAATRD